MKDNIIPAVEKTIRLLDHLAGASAGATQAELAQLLDISGATCYRIIQSLLKYGWLRKNGSRLELAQGLLPLAKRILQMEDWQERIKPLLLELAQKTRLSVKLSLRHGTSEYITAFRAESPQPMAVTGRIGATFPVIEGSVGGALLADSSEKELQRLIQAAPEGLLEKSEPELLLQRIQECRKNGFCRSNGKNRWGIEVLTAPVHQGGQVLAAISVLGLLPDFEDIDALTGALLQCRQKVEELL